MGSDPCAVRANDFAGRTSLGQRFPSNWLCQMIRPHVDRTPVMVGPSATYPATRGGPLARLVATNLAAPRQIHPPVQSATNLLRQLATSRVPPHLSSALLDRSGDWFMARRFAGIHKRRIVHVKKIPKPRSELSEPRELVRIAVKHAFLVSAGSKGPADDALAPLDRT